MPSCCGKQIAEGESAVVRTRFDGHGAMAGGVLFHVQDEAVVRVMHLADLLIAQRVVVHAAAGIAVDDADIRSERRLVRKLESERGVIEDRFAAEGGRIDELAGLRSR